MHSQVSRTYDPEADDARSILTDAYDLAREGDDSYIECGALLRDLTAILDELMGASRGEDGKGAIGLGYDDIN